MGYGPVAARHMREARDQSSRSREAIDQLGFHRVMHENEDDGDARRRSSEDPAGYRITGEPNAGDLIASPRPEPQEC